MQNYERERSTSRNMKKSLELRAAISGKQQKNTRTNQVSAQSSISIPNESPLEHLSRTGFFNCLYAMDAVRRVASTPFFFAPRTNAAVFGPHFMTENECSVAVSLPVILLSVLGAFNRDFRTAMGTSGSSERFTLTTPSMIRVNARSSFRLIVSVCLTRPRIW